MTARFRGGRIHLRVSLRHRFVQGLSGDCTAQRFNLGRPRGLVRILDKRLRTFNKADAGVSG